MFFSDKKQLELELRQKDSDTERLLECMERIIKGDYSPVDEEGFFDKSLVQRYNEMLDASMDRNNRMVMRLNDAMNRIGDSELVKNMLEEVDSQTTSINDMRAASEGLGSSISNIQESAENIRESSHQVISSSRGCMEKMSECLHLVDEGARSIGSISQEMAGFADKAQKINEIID